MTSQLEPGEQDRLLGIALDLVRNGESRDQVVSTLEDEGAPRYQAEKLATFAEDVVSSSFGLAAFVSLASFR